MGREEFDHGLTGRVVNDFGAPDADGIQSMRKETFSSEGENRLSLAKCHIDVNGARAAAYAKHQYRKSERAKVAHALTMRPS